MQANVNTNVERIIAKIDNDFNPDNSDWIPRVGAWCIDAMSQLDVLRTKRKKKKLTVKDRIAYSECAINNSSLKVYDKNGCEVKEASDSRDCCGSLSTGEESDASTTDLSITMSTVNQSANAVPDYILAETLNDKGWPGRYRVNEFNYGNGETKEKNYVLVDCNKIEINWDANYIYVETEYIETTCSELYGCELPVIPNNGILIEAIAYYCIYKMLCRGNKHPVFNLNASQYGTNPYYIWTQLKEEAKRSVINDGVDDKASKLFRSNLFINTFDPR